MTFTARDRQTHYIRLHFAEAQSPQTKLSN
jgi:hypothetical protein